MIRSWPCGARRSMDWDEYFRQQAAMYRKLAETTEDAFIKQELLDLAAVCEEVANNIEDRQTSGYDVRLPRSYTSIRLRRVNALFDISNQPAILTFFQEMEMARTNSSGMMDVFKKMWPEAWGVRMEHILRNVLMALLEQPDATFHDVLRIFSDNEFRKQTAK
jgi:hypothetical protein